ncbi:hypothetical protein QBC34DRAFT_490383 [Podospora aff. communis PSN243]|uniref:Uncharacterized protein n=1 Tax=Podospora aff. communis PSN243 TaxID=3040156 RepID=A0AAV9H4Z7_9PEZI|nr:hypothetical protein QBC34DRAFT_490383 [Podospora aff. communis PSN243]
MPSSDIAARHRLGLSGTRPHPANCNEGIMRTKYKMMVACVGTGSEECRGCDEGLMEDPANPRWRTALMGRGRQPTASAASALTGEERGPKHLATVTAEKLDVSSLVVPWRWRGCLKHPSPFARRILCIRADTEQLSRSSAGLSLYAAAAGPHPDVFMPSWTFPLPPPPLLDAVRDKRRRSLIGNRHRLTTEIGPTRETTMGHRAASIPFRAAVVPISVAGSGRSCCPDCFDGAKSSHGLVEHHLSFTALGGAAATTKGGNGRWIEAQHFCGGPPQRMFPLLMSQLPGHGKTRVWGQHPWIDIGDGSSTRCRVVIAAKIDDAVKALIDKERGHQGACGSSTSDPLWTARGRSSCAANALEQAAMARQQAGDDGYPTGKMNPQKRTGQWVHRVGGECAGAQRVRA